MKIYQINVTARFSTGILAGAIHKELLKRGHQARFAYGFGGELQPGYLQLADIWTLRLNARWNALTGSNAGLLKHPTQKLLRDIRAFDPDLIHIHNLHGNYVDCRRVLNALAALHKPVVITLHDCWFYTGGCFHYTVNHCDQWQTECIDCPHQNSYALRSVRPMENASFLQKKRALDAIENLSVTTVSEWLKREAEKSFLKNREIVCIPNGIDNRLFAPCDARQLRKKLGCEGKTVLLGVASTWSNRKGLQTWIELSHRLPDSYQIVLVGMNAQQIAALPGNVIGLPRVSSAEELVQLYNLADVYINLSKEETFGLPTVEAMASGTPVIVLDSTANPELVTPEVGYIAKPDSIEEILQGIETVCAKGKARMQPDCIARVDALYSQARMAESYIDFYEKIAGEKRA